nr:DNA alkylation repair protein [Vagococcus fluvialis]
MKPFQLIPEPDNKIPMENYMKNNFIFLGVKSPSRKEQSKDLIKQSRYMTSKERFILVMDLYSKTEREYQYIAIDICQVNASKMNYDELIAYLPLIEEKAWWDSVDAWRKVFGDYIKNTLMRKRKSLSYFSSILIFG